jgi:hypothetical protein
MDVCMFMCILCMYVRVCVCMYVCMIVCILCMYVRVCVCMYVCMYVCMCSYVFFLLVYSQNAP